MQITRIILSADKSLQQERMELADLVENLNHSLENRDAKILMLVWDGSEAKTDDFKEKVSNTDICLTLYYDTFDAFTQSELDMAYQSLCDGKNPKKIYVYFKEGETISRQLQEFRDSFPTKYGHFYCSFSNIDTLKADFLLQFMEYQSKNIGSINMLKINNGKVTIDGKEYVDLKNVPFAGNNEEYNLLLKSIKKTQKLLSITDEDDPDYADYAADLQYMKEKLSKMESSLWDTALMITRLSSTKCSERLKRAMDMFSAGDNKGAQAVLNEEEIERDVEHNLHLIQLGEEGRNGLKMNVEEYELKIKTIKNEYADSWESRIFDIYKKVCNSINETHLSFDELYTFRNVAYRSLTEDIIDFDSHSLLNSIIHDVCLETLRFVLNSLHSDITSKICSYKRLAEAYLLKEDYNQSVYYLELALGLIADKKNQEYFELYFLLGDSYYFDNRYEKALEYYFIVLYTEKKHLKHFAYRKIGDCYKVIGNQEKSIENYLSALALTENKEQIRRINQDLGFSFYNIKNYKEAKSHLNYALQLAYEKYEKSGLDYKSRVRKIIYTLNIIEQQLKL